MQSMLVAEETVYRFETVCHRPYGRGTFLDV
jgi:hypothetical protein